MSLRFVPCIFHASYIPEKRNQLELGSNHPRLDFYPGTQDLNGSCPLIGLPCSFFVIRRKNGFEVVHPSDVCMLLQFTKPIFLPAIPHSWSQNFSLPESADPMVSTCFNCFPHTFRVKFPVHPGHRHGWRIAALSTDVGMSRRRLCSWQQLGLCPCVEVLMRPGVTGFGSENWGCHGIYGDLMDFLTGLSW